VDIGHERPGFLHVDDVMPTHVPGRSVVPEFAERSAPGGGSDIVGLLQKGQEIVVQVTRDAIGHKGPSLTTHISLAGRIVVLLPSLRRVGVSRRVTDPTARDAARARLSRLGFAEDAGFVIRTAGPSAGDDELRDEAERLLAELAEIRARFAATRAPALLRREGGFVERALRDLLVRRVEGAVGDTVVVVDTHEAAREVGALFASADSRPSVTVHESTVPLFHAQGVEAEVRRLSSHRVPLTGGASLVIQGTEALWAIDVNSGRLRRGANLEETALETDVLAAHEVARQIRLRDLGGLIVVDFIDCREPENRRLVEETFRTELAKDPARLRSAALSEFMVVEITRRRLRRGPSFVGSTVCPCCAGRGRVWRSRAAGLAVLRDVLERLGNGEQRALEVRCAPDVRADLDTRDADLSQARDAFGVDVRVTEDATLPPGTYTLG
jgi:Rne/Rng family ribonuclease